MSSEVEPDEGDRERMLAEVDRFARLAIEPKAARPEAPMDDATLGALLGEAEELGLAGGEEHPTGLGPWDELERGRGPSATLAMLARLGRANAALAFVLHQRALARAVTRAHALGRAHGPLAIAAEGRLGLGRTALSRALFGQALDKGDRALLTDVYAPDAPHVLPLDTAAKGIVSLAFDGAAFTFQLHAAVAVARVGHGQGHGLDELRMAHVKPLREPTWTAPARADAIARVMMANQLGLVAIAIGAAERAHALARAYAAERRQGGRVIDRHAAVLGLLGKARAAIDSVSAQLEAHGAHALGPARLGRVLGLRAEAGPALAEAAHASVQVFGGLGYMRDTGVEKVARDVNALRVMAGTPPELLMIAAEWERLHG